MVALTVARLSGQLRPRTFQHITFQFLNDYSLKQKIVFIHTTYFNIPKCQLEIQSVFWTHSLGNPGTFLQLGEELLRGVRLPFGEPRSNDHHIKLSEVRLHVGVHPTRPLEARRPPPAIHLRGSISQPSHQAKEAGRQGFGGPQLDAEVLERRPCHAEKLH